MASPYWRIRASGMGGSGYACPALPGEPFKEIKNSDGNVLRAAVDSWGDVKRYIGVTTALKHEGADALIQWSVDQVSAYAVTHIDDLLSRTEEQGWGFLRYYHRRTPDFDNDPLRTAHKGVLNDAADLGTWAHELMEARLTGGFAPEPVVPEHYQLADAIDAWLFENEVEALSVEQTLWNHDWEYAGTYDAILNLNGVRTCVDFKSSRAIRTGHKRQLAALDHAESAYRKTAEGWVEAERPQYEKYGFVQFRPADTDSKGNYIAPFCTFHEVEKEELDLHWIGFQGCMMQAKSDRLVKDYEKGGKR